MGRLRREMKQSAQKTKHFRAAGVPPIRQSERVDEAGLSAELLVPGQRHDNLRLVAKDHIAAIDCDIAGEDSAHPDRGLMNTESERQRIAGLGREILRQGRAEVDLTGPQIGKTQHRAIASAEGAEDAIEIRRDRQHIDIRQCEASARRNQRHCAITLVERRDGLNRVVTAYSREIPRHLLLAEGASNRFVEITNSGRLPGVG